MQFDLHSFRSYLGEHSALNNLRVLSEGEKGHFPNGQLTFSFEIGIDGDPVPMLGILDRDFPSSLPIFFCLKPRSLGFIPHITPEGFVCYQDPEGLLIHSRNPKAVFEQALEKMVTMIKQGRAGTNSDDFLNEIGYYWHKLGGASQVFSIIDPGNPEIRRMTLVRRKLYSKRKGGERVLSIVGEDESRVRNFLPRLGSNQGKDEVFRTWYIPLESYEGFIPPKYGTFWQPRDLENILVPRLSNKNRQLLKQRMDEKLSRWEFLIISLPLPNGSRSLIGLTLESPAYRRAGSNINERPFIHQILSPKGNVVLRPVAIERLDKKYLLERGGANFTLSSKRILLIGCGAIGSQVALELAKAGVQDLTLVDHDNISLDNVHRHVIGFDQACLQQPKILALKHKIETDFRHISVDAQEGKVQHLIEDGKLDWKKFDLVICATGDPNTELRLNRQVQSTKNTPPVMFTWVESLGLGGHILLSNTNRRKGCLNCLYTSGENDEAASDFNRASFAAKGQSFAKSIGGCHTRFTPFSSLDATRTALECVRIAIDTLNSTYSENFLFSWKGNPSEFIRNGYSLSPRYSYSEEELHATRRDFIHPNCSHCQNQSSS